MIACRQPVSPPSLVEDKHRRINIKSKRRRNFLKKAIELKAMCGLEMLVVIKDNEFAKVTVYNEMDLQTHGSQQFLSELVSKGNNSELMTTIDEYKVQFIDDSCFERLIVDKEPLVKRHSVVGELQDNT